MCICVYLRVGVCTQVGNTTQAFWGQEKLAYMRLICRVIVMRLNVSHVIPVRTNSTDSSKKLTVRWEDKKACTGN